MDILLHDGSPELVDDLRDDGVAECSKSVHPAGNPCSHSTHVGFRAPDSFDTTIPRFI
jgi:hypothetical protein